METKIIHLSPKRGGHGHVTSYSINIGSAEARACGFMDEDGIPFSLEKQIDSKSGCITLRPIKEEYKHV